jgi:hypothetical protein
LYFQAKRENHSAALAFGVVSVVGRAGARAMLIVLLAELDCFTAMTSRSYFSGIKNVIHVIMSHQSCPTLLPQ